MIEQPSATLCRCGGLLASCADCRGWLVENSPRIANAWAWWLHMGSGQEWGADAAEAECVAWFESWL